jgi:hypothetical protein
MKTYKSVDSFKMSIPRSTEFVYVILFEIGVDIIPNPGEVVSIDGKEVKVLSADLRSSCFCGQCGLKNRLYVMTPS